MCCHVLRGCASSCCHVLCKCDLSFGYVSITVRINKDITAECKPLFALQSTVMKKKMYYNMRVKTVKRNLADVASRVKKLRNQLLQFPYDRLKALLHAIKQVCLQRACLSERHCPSLNSLICRSCRLFFFFNLHMHS